MEQCTNHGSQPHGQDTILLHQENASLKEKVVMLEMQVIRRACNDSCVYSDSCGCTLSPLGVHLTLVGVHLTRVGVHLTRVGVHLTLVSVHL